MTMTMMPTNPMANTMTLASGAMTREADSMWSYFDRIVVISLRDKADRQAHIRQFLPSIGITDYSFYLADRDPRGGLVGCMTSYAAVMRSALADKQCNKILIFEDDVTCSPAYDVRIMREAIAFLRQQNIGTWDVLRFGYTPVGSLRVPEWPGNVVQFVTAAHATPHVVRLAHAALSHANVYSRACMEFLVPVMEAYLSQPERITEHIDLFMARLLSPRNRSFAVVPMQFDQLWCMGTDNNGGGPTEHVLRSASCGVGEKAKMITWVSYAPHFKFTFALVVVVLAAMLFLIASAIVHAAIFLWRFRV